MKTLWQVTVEFPDGRIEQKGLYENQGVANQVASDADADWRAHKVLYDAQNPDAPEFAFTVRVDQA